MSNNAIMDWANQGHVDTESWGRYLAQHYAKTSPAENAESCASDAPYSFWLGADRG